MKHSMKWAGAVAVVIAAFGLSIRAAQSDAPERTDDNRRAEAARQAETGPAARVLDDNSVMVVGVWRNGKGHIIVIPARRVQVNTVGGPFERLEPAVPDPTAFIERHLPPRDPELDKITPTPAQEAEMRARTDAEQARHEPWRRLGPSPDDNPPVEEQFYEPVEVPNPS